MNAVLMDVTTRWLEFITINKYEAPHTKLLTSLLLVMKREENGVMKIDTTVIQQPTYDDFGHVVANDYSGTAADMQYAYAKDPTDYCGSLILRNAHPSQYLFEGGYACFDADTLSGWHYYVQDYMGNNRMVVNAQTNEIEQETHYYPYGGVIGDISTNENLQAYKFEGKVLAAIEKIDNLRREDEPLDEGQACTFGLDWYDIQARQYDAIGGTWYAIDPLAEKTPEMSPYVMCAGNPVNFGDYDGMDWYSTTDSLGNIHYQYTEYTSQEEMGKNGVNGEYLGEALVIFNGRNDESLSNFGFLTGEGSTVATITIYGINGADDIVSDYRGLSVSSDSSQYPMIEEGDYHAYYEKMQTSIYAKDAKTYRVANLDGSLRLNPVGGRNKRTGKDYIEGVFLHRTDWNGKADKSSHACLVIDGRQWRSVERQLGKSTRILIKLQR